jgi:uncharacterized glyoxalase superfamily protein PhnB
MLSQLELFPGDCLPSRMGAPGGVTCHVEVDNLDALMAEWKARRPEFAQEITISPWSAKHVDLKDPFGNSLGINQNLADDADT